MRKNVFIWLSVFLTQIIVFSFNAKATTGTVQIGSGTLYNSTTSHPTPYGTYYKNHRVQYLYLANELSAAGLAAGNITELAFNVQAVNNCSAMPNFTIKAKLTSATSLTTTFDYAGYTTVYTNTSFLPVAGWNTHVLTTPIYWDGISNLLVDICFDLVTTTTQNASVYYTTTTGNLSSYYRNDSQTACGTTSSGTTSTNRANIKITGNTTTCLPPTLSVSNILSSSATINWTSTASQFQLEYGTQGFTLGTGTRINTTTTSYPLTGLNPVTNYQVYVRAICGAGDTSNWTSISFTTLCAPISTFPWGENFDAVTIPSLPSCWFKENGDWETTNNANSSSDADAYSGTQFLRESYSATNEYVWTPGFSLTGGTSYDFSFWWAGDNYSGWTGDVFVNSSQISTGATQLGTSFVTSTVTTTKTYQKQKYTFVPASTGTYYFAIRVNASSTPWYLSFDNFKVELTPTCPAPSSMTASNITANTATISWTSTASLFQLEYGLQGYTPGTGTLINNINTTSYQLTGLNPGTSYKAYVRAICAPGDTSQVANVSFTTTQQPATLPYFINFESGTEQWTILNGSQTNQWAYGTATASSGTHSIYISNDNGTTNSYTSSSTSVAHIYRDVTFPSTTNPFIVEFKWKGQGESGYDDLKVYMIPTSQTPVVGTQLTATQIGNTYNLQGTWQTASFQLPDTLASKTKRFVFSWRNDGSGGTQPPIAVDDIHIYELTCPAPASVAVNNLSSTSATINWTSTASQFQLEYGAPGFTLGTGTRITNIPSATYQLTALTPATNYQAYVRAVCGSGDTSNWSSISFLTLCTEVDSLNETFDAVITPALPSCWYKVGTTGTVNTQASNSYSSPNCLYLYGTSSSSPAYVSLPALSNAGNNTHRLRFRMRGNSSAGGVVQVGYLTNPSNASTFVSVQSVTASTITYQEYIVYLGTAPGTNKVLAFKHTGNPANSVLIDNVIWESVPTCVPPILLTATNVLSTSATINWTSSASGFQLEYGAQGFTLGTGTRINNITTTNYQMTGLTATTNYQVYVRAICGAGDTSTWASFSFVTPCSEIVSFPWSESFSGSTFPPTCWMRAEGTLAPPVTFTSTTSSYWIDDGFANNGTTGSARLNIYGTSRYEWLITPTINIGDGTTNYRLEFDLALTAYGSTGAAGTSGTDDKFAVVISTDGGTTWSSANTLRLWDNQGSSSVYNNIATAGEHVIINLTGYTGYVRIGFYGESTVSNADNDLFVDNITIKQLSTCPEPYSLTATGITQNSANLSWTASGSETTWNIEYGLAGFTQGTGTVINGVTNPYTLSGLNADATYTYYVQAVCGGSDVSIWSIPHTFTTTQIPAIFPYSINFESGTEQWDILNDSNVNQWHYGTATANSGTHSMYISDDNGVSNNYNTSSSSVVHFYRDVTIPVSTFPKMLDFSWKGEGESSFDDLKVYMIPTSQIPVVGTPLTATQLGITYNLQSLWQNASIQLPDSIAGKTKRFVFSWRNDVSGGTQPPAALDDISFYLLTCPKPTALTVTGITQNSATVNWTSTATQFQLEYGIQGFTLGTGTRINTTTTSYPLTGLANATNYQVYVRAVCGAGDTSTWTTSVSFSTLQIPATLPYFINFESGTDQWTALNISASNQWHYGTATANSGTHSMYISDDNGVSNNYNTSSSSVVHFYRDVTIPLTANPKMLEFSWKGQGESGYDYLKVYMIPTSQIPVVGTQLTATQLGSTYNLQSSWQNASIQLPDSIAGKTKRFVFSWRSDGSGGTQPPAALDDIHFYILTCPKPTSLTASSITQNSANIGWTAGGSETQWQVQYGLQGFLLGSGTNQLSTTNPVTVSGLTSGSYYSFYVRAICGAGDTSTWAGPYNFVTSCGSTTVTYIQNFDNITPPVIPICWDTIVMASTGTPNIQTTTTSPYSAPNCIQLFNSTATGSTTHILLITPQFSDLPSHTTQITFKAKFSGTGSPVLYVGTMIDPNNPGTFSNFKTITTINTTWQEFTVRFDTYNGSNQYIAFKHGLSASNQYFYIDNVSYEPIPTCPKPQNLTVSNISGTGATISWVAGGSETAWDIEYGPSGFTHGTGTVIQNVSTTTYTFTTLNPTTTYDVYVSAQCSPTDSSAWLGPVTFTTPQVPATLPYVWNFENDFFNWSVVNGTQTNKWVTGTATCFSPTKSAYISNTSGTTNNYDGTVASVSHIYRDVQFPAGSEFVMLFKWKGVGESTYDYMRIFLNNTTYTPVAGTLPTTGQIGKTYYNQNSTWKTDTILFNSTVANSLKRLIFTWNNDVSGAYQPPIAIDDINIYVVTCARPTNLTATNITPSASDLGWTSQGSEAQWQIQYGLQGFALGSGTNQLTTTNPVTVSGFSSGMNYSFYVRAICGAGDTSFWAGPYNFYIPCNAFTATYTQHFDGVTTPDLPMCWSKKVVASSSYAVVETSTNTPSSYPNCVYLYNSSAIGTSTHILLATPAFSDLTSHLNRIRFNLKGTTTEKLIVGTMSNPADENTFVPFDTLSIPSSSLWTQETVSFLSYQGTNTFIAFKHAATTTYSYIYIDDFVYEPLPTVDLAVTKITQPVNGCGLTNAETIKVRIKNMAVNAFTNFHVAYKINSNPAISPETVNATLNPGDSMIYQFATTADLSLPGGYTISAYICEATDQDHSNDTAYSQVVSSPIISTFPYIDDFEVNSGAWVAGGVNSSWQWGTPAGSIINTAASGTKAWVTNLTGTYNNSENSYVVGPCFDLTSISTPYVRIKRFVNAENSYDGAALQYSLNGGNTWTNVGTVGDQTNWYNDNSISGLSFTGSQEGWTGQETSWVSSSHVLTGLGGQPSVKFRIVFGSDASVTYEGFAFDDFTIYQPVDLSIVSPIDGSTIQKCNLTSNETLSIWIKNAGASLVPAGEKIRTWYKVDSHTPVADTLTLANNLMPNDSILYTFPQHYDFSALTTYVVSYWIKYGADINTANDTSITTLVHFNLTVNISGGDTLCVDPLFLPYTLTLQAGSYPYDTYTWSNASGSLTGHNSMFDAPSFGWYFVTVTNGSCTASDSIFVCDITNVPEVTSPEINVYPSPATVQLNVSATSIPVDNYLLQLTTMDGKLIIQKSFYHTDIINTIIPTVKLPEGIYVLSITNSRNTWKFKVVH